MCIIYKYKVHLNIRITQKVHALISIVGGKVACALMKQCNNYIKLQAWALKTVMKGHQNTPKIKQTTQRHKQPAE